MTDPIILHVDYTFDDLKELNLAHAKRERKRQWWIFVTVVAVIVGTVILSSLISPAPPTPPPPPPTGTAPQLGTALHDICAPIVPWLIALATIIVLLKLYLRSIYKRAYEEKNPLQRHHVIELSPQRVVSTEPFARHDYQWDAFGRWIESDHLLLLYLSYNMMLPIPKRCFASAEQLEQCRGLLRAMIDTPATARQAFPLVPTPPTAAEVLPIPPLHQPPPLPQTPPAPEPPR